LKSKCSCISSTGWSRSYPRFSRISKNQDKCSPSSLQRQNRYRTRRRRGTWDTALFIPHPLWD